VVRFHIGCNLDTIQADFGNLHRQALDVVQYFLGRAITQFAGNDVKDLTQAYQTQMNVYRLYSPAPAGL